MKNEQTTKKQHPVPQNIMEVEFKLIGDMTIRQFAYVAVGGFVAYLIFASSLSAVVRWPLALFVAFFALGLAFLPIEERGFDEWIKAFFVACYSPTQYVWGDRAKAERSQPVSKKEEKKEKRLERKERKKAQKATERKKEKEEKRDTDVEEIRKKMKDLVREDSRSDRKKFEKKAKGLAHDLDRMLSSLRGGKKDGDGGKLQGENIVLRKRLKSLSSELERLRKNERIKSDEKTIGYYRDKIKTLEEKLNAVEEAQQEEKPEVTEKTEEEKKFRKDVEKLKREREQARDELQKMRESLAASEEKEEEWGEEQKGLARKLAEREKELARLERERNQAMKKLAKLRKSKQYDGKEEDGKKRAEEDAEKEMKKKIAEQKKKQEKERQPQKKKDVEKIAPIIDGLPNVINGVVRDKEGNLLDGIMVVVEDDDGDPVRALRTNRLGQFVISTPLSDGKYTVKVENKQRAFGEKQVFLDGNVLDPILFEEK